jgi:hypothetical protein
MNAPNGRDRPAATGRRGQQFGDDCGGDESDSRYERHELARRRIDRALDDV